MKEIEVKVLKIDIEKTREDIINLGGKLIKKEFQENYYYKLPESLSNQKGYIRIRKVHNLLDGSRKILLCIKTLISQEKYRTCDEHEFEVSNFKECTLFLEAMKLSYIKSENKHRESYSIDNSLIEIDTWDKDVFPEPYIEIEAACEEDIFNLLSKLNINKNKATSKSLEEIKKEMGLI
ncbi:adenylate cyclase, class 2 [Caloramator quimbayensis]|uniref:Adenylate cyclase, class 2 n=1 Tax=Caloramator quimbayensis TaxID=1147123 RepID=A0A1T4X6L7_9CLOT|nr:class IV adenylate cyclase [Caloramator quimbayensis]SKA85242.1 adenylate cyclase, class 2 [Caloramator quimbayensis]